MKRLHNITKPTSVANVGDIDVDSLVDNWQLRAKKFETRRLRKFNHSWA